MRKKQKVWIYSGLITLFIIMFILLIWALTKIKTDLFTNILIIFGMFVVLGIVIMLLYFAIYNFAKSRELINKSFNGFLEKIMTNNNIGLIIYDIDQNIVWTSNFIKNKFHKDFINWSINQFFEKIDDNYQKEVDLNQTKLEFYNNKNIYEAQFWPLSNTIVIRDITSEHLFKVEAWEQKPVIGEIEIDNYQMYQSILSEEQLFIVNKIVIDTIKEYMERYNLIYRQYTNGKFVVITNEKSLQEMSKDNFSLFTNIHQNVNDTAINKLSLSVGFAHGWSSLKEKLEQAKKALVQAQNRGGDQIAIFSNVQPAVYFGSNSEIMSNNNKTKIKAVALEFSKRLQDKTIEKVIVYGHSLADLDALGSSYAIVEVARSFGKDAYICNITFDQTTEKYLNELKTESDFDTGIFIKPAHATKITDANTLVVLVDNSDINRTDNKDGVINALRNNIFVFDHHRVGKSIDFCPLTNIYIDTTASSASEIVTEIMTFMDYNLHISQLCAQLLLSGIYLDTAQFSKSVTTRTFEASAWLESKGANVIKSGNLLKIDDETEEQIQKLLQNTQEVKSGYYLAYSDIEVSNDVISMAANEILRIKGREASFVVAKLKDTKKYKLSARGIATNVQIICEQVGGGGHFSTAAATSDEDLETFVDNIRHAIITSEREIQDESNIN
ncbi:DHH family phosphoesterase [Mycoplasmopsis verecunda]|uniref:C-di-AMP phosphodiesterase, consists of a GGDEF-like and DHH domains n=1 Tax=Mycoplasmopsis verecunda TaxID=171291 RepID=A0A1T4LCC4_9BACT|nr:DHH family phosphoesterase [Mycoplasmopsis verecunda]WPB54810.1 DHH family phosphoesterase [Mycoplasmopsis verecunda]SJZ52187.1 c-di-AMP phosphodiesterase, consists of a GGDEF-like and DHH domains [Mycoplasmopsis verecunda]